MIAIAVATGLAVIMIRPAQTFEWSQVHPAIRELSRPYREVMVEEWLDGGSIGISIVDAKGHTANLVLLVEATSRGNRYEQLGQLAQKHSTKDMARIPLSADTRNCLVQLVEAHRGINGEGDLALMNLRGWARDHLNAWVFLWMLMVLNAFAHR